MERPTGAKMGRRRMFCHENAVAVLHGASKKAFDITRKLAHGFRNKPESKWASNAIVLRPLGNGFDLSVVGEHQLSGSSTLDEDLMVNPTALSGSAVFRSYLTRRKAGKEQACKLVAACETLSGTCATPSVATTDTIIIATIAAKAPDFVWMSYHLRPIRRRCCPPADDTTLASCARGFTKSGRCACARGWALATTRVTRPPPASETFLPCRPDADTAHQRTETLDDGAVIPAGLGVHGSTSSPPQGERRCARCIASPRCEAPERSARAMAESARVDGAGAEVIPRHGQKPVPGSHPAALNLPAADLAELEKRTLTNLYNQRPAGWPDAHAR